MSVKLTAKQQSFVYEYLIDLNGTQAAIRAGYSKKTAQQIATENLSKPLIQGAITKAQEERARRVQVTADDVLRDLITIKNRCMQAEPVMMYEDGEQVASGEYKFEHTGANKSLELIGKHLKMFTDKVEQQNTGAITVNVLQDDIDAL